MNRDIFKSKICYCVRDIVPKSKIYGSFSNDTYHYCEQDHISYSDVDVLVPNTESDSLSNCSEQIKQRILDETGLRIRVSCRDDIIHHAGLNESIVENVAIFEYLYHSHLYTAPRHRFYLQHKLFLRLNLKNNLFCNSFSELDHLLSSDQSLLDSLFVKIGLKIPDELSSDAHKRLWKEYSFSFLESRQIEFLSKMQSIAKRTFEMGFNQISFDMFDKLEHLKFNSPALKNQIAVDNKYF